MREIIKKNYRDTSYLLHKDASREKRVLTFDTHIGFPMGIIEETIPPGHYYLATNAANKTLVLLLAPLNASNTDTRVDLDFDSDLARQKELHQAAMLQSRLQDVRSWYFPIHQYHRELGITHEAILRFLKQKSFFQQVGLDYKRSVLFYGDTGTGKSSYLHFLTQYLIDEHQAIVLHAHNAATLYSMSTNALPMLRVLADGRLLVIVIEELSNLDKKYHPALLNLLDHAVLRDNLLFLMTTNSPELLPENIIDRPSRVDILAEVDAEGYQPGFIQAWYHYITGKSFPESWNGHSFMAAGLSPAYLKELFILTEVEEISVDAAWKRLKKRRVLLQSGFTKPSV